MIVFPMQNAFGVIAMVVQSTSIYYHKGVCHHDLYHLWHNRGHLVNVPQNIP